MIKFVKVLRVNQKYYRHNTQFVNNNIMKSYFIGSIFQFNKMIYFLGRVTIVTNNLLTSRGDVRRRCAQYRPYKTQGLTTKATHNFLTYTDRHFIVLLEGICLAEKFVGTQDATLT